MNPHQKLWNQQQQALRIVLSYPEEHQKAIALFLDQHAMVHTAAVSGSGLYSFEDEVWTDLTEEASRCIPLKHDHSIVWCFWHLTRIEDVTMNLLLAGTPQLFLRDGWLERLKVPYRDTGNGMNAADIARLSASIDIEALRAYRLAIGKRTREIVLGLRAEEMKDQVEPARLQQVMNEGTVLEAGRGVVEYWGRRNKAGLLLMPPTRHSMVHLNEALGLKRI